MSSPHRVERGVQGSGFLDRQVEHQHAVDTSIGARPARTVRGPGARRVGVREQHHGRADVRPRRTNHRQRRGQRGPAAERAFRRALNDGAIGQRIRKRHADLEHVGAGRDRARAGWRQSGRWTDRRRSRTSRARSAPGRPQPFEGPRDARAHNRPPVATTVAASSARAPPRRDSAFATLCTSLSPRPDRFTRTSPPVPTWRATSASAANACDDSSAGRIPSRLRQHLERVERLVVRDVHVVRPAALAQPRMLGTDGRIVEARGDRMGQLDVAGRVLQHERPRALEHARRAAGESRRMTPGQNRRAACLDANQPHRLRRR